MRVLIILKYIPSANRHQKSDLLRSTISAHVAEGHEVVLLTTGSSSKHEWTEIKVKRSLLERIWTAIIRRYFPFFIGTFLSFFIAKRVARYHKLHPIDFVLAECTNYRPAIYAYEINRVLGIPYVIREHKMYERTIKSVEDLPKSYLLALHAADVVVAVSPMLADLMKRIGIRDDIRCIPNALSDEFYSPPAKPGPYRNWAESDFIFAGWTRWRDFKRVDLLLKAFTQMKESGYRVRLVIAGPIEPVDNEQWVHSYIREKGLADKVWLTGYASRSDIHQLAYACDCCVVTSDYETFGLPALEALSAGKPVVTTRCSGPEFLVDSRELGRVVERGSAEAILEGMMEVYKNYDSFDQTEIRRITFNRFSRSAVAGHFTALYEGLSAKNV